MKVLLFFFFLFIGVHCQKAKFYNYELQRLTPQNETQVEALQKLSYTNEYIYLTFPTKIGRGVDIIVPPHMQPEFQQFVDFHNISQVLRMTNYQSLLDEEENILNARPKQMEWTTYHNLDEIYQWLDDLSQRYPEVKKIVAGKTYEGRDIQGVEITFGKNFTGVFIEAGIHACEWIGPAGTSWIVNEILKSPQDSVFRQFNYIYVPLFNPDGYVYSWEKNRLWRKTRKPYPTDNKICYGADPNRNWDHHWNEFGTAQDPCASNYAGPHPFSEIETKSLSEFISSSVKPKKIELYFAFHSYYQLLLFPHGWSPNPAPHHQLWMRVAEAAVADLEGVHGTKFAFGDGYHTIWPTSGATKDWVYGKHNVTISFLFEMRDTGEYGFVLPSHNIIPAGEEHLAALKRILIEYQSLNVEHNYSLGFMDDSCEELKNFKFRVSPEVDVFMYGINYTFDLPGAKELQCLIVDFSKICLGPYLRETFNFFFRAFELSFDV